MKISVVSAVAAFLLSTTAMGGELNGAWSTGCMDDDGTQGNYTYTFSDDSFTGVMTNYNDAECKQGILTFAIQASYVGGTEAPRAPAKIFDATVVSVTATLHDARYVDYFNQSTVCGFSDWALDVAKDLTGATCGDEKMASAGDKMYNIYAISGNQLTLGETTDELDGKTPETRPTELDSTYVYTRQ